MNHISNLGADADIVITALRKIENPQVDLVSKLENSLGWSNERLRVAVEALRAHNRVGPILNDSDGGTPRLVGFEVRELS
jgi:hypothetical protein